MIESRKPTDASIARAFWEWTKFNFDGSPVWKECERTVKTSIIRMAEKMDAESNNNQEVKCESTRQQS